MSKREQRIEAARQAAVAAASAAMSKWDPLEGGGNDLTVAIETVRVACLAARKAAGRFSDLDVNPLHAVASALYPIIVGDRDIAAVYECRGSVPIQAFAAVATASFALSFSGISMDGSDLSWSPLLSKVRSA